MENVLRRRPFVGDPKSGDDSDSDSDSSDCEAFRVESTGIFMVSLPDSLEEKDDSTSHLYQTPPEELLPTGSEEQRSAAVDVAEANGAEVGGECMDDGTAVDLGRDTDVGLYSEVQSASKTGEREKSVEIIGVCRSRITGSEEEGFGYRESVVSLGESSSKRLKLSVDSTNFGEGPKVVLPSSVSRNNGDDDYGGECKLKGTDDAKVIDGDDGGIPCNYKEKSPEKEVKGGPKNSELHRSIELQETGNCRQPSSRLLPASINGEKNNAAAGEKSNASEEPIVFTVLGILKNLKGEEEEGEFDDESLSKMSILELVQRRGMTFPRPEWWPPEA